MAGFDAAPVELQVCGSMLAEIGNDGTCSPNPAPGLPELTRDSRAGRPMLDMLGLRSYAIYAKGTKSVGVRRNEEKIAITPKHNGGTAGHRSHCRVDKAT